MFFNSYEYEYNASFRHRFRNKDKKITFLCIRSEVLVTMKMKISFFQVLAPNVLVSGYERFGGTYSFPETLTNRFIDSFT